MSFKRKVKRKNVFYHCGVKIKGDYKYGYYCPVCKKRITINQQI
ncbi:MAG TPA: hypothetical protein PKL77_06040 [Candidatus Omnitrophota bacterium]|nr:hypothetical protein [Candidatus Omnitrophota bacterium]